MEKRAKKFLTIVAIVPLILGFIVDTPQNIIEGFYNIFTGSDVLIVDYIAVGGLGATLINVGFVVLVSLIILVVSKADMNGAAFASVFLMGSFSFFGKNILNIWPILIGTLLYAKITKESYRDIVHMSLLATSFAPLFTELIKFLPIPLVPSVIISFIISASVGFVIKPVARHLLKMHEGFILYNIGFSIGILSTLIVSLMRSYGYQAQSQLILDSGNTVTYTIALSLFFALLMYNAFYLNPKVLGKYKILLKETGYLDHDFLIKYGFDTTLLNMSVNGFFSLFYVLVIAKGELNGPIIGAILTVVGFSGYGKHLFNIAPIFIGVFLGSLTKTWSANEPAILFAALFGTSLAPLSGYYGFFWGIIASFINSSVVMNSGQLHLGMNLYNTGFSTGIVASVMVPILQKFINKRGKPRNRYY